MSLREVDESNRIIEEIRNNPMLLSKWTSWDNVSESGDGFFGYKGNVYLFDGKYRAYYIVTSIVDNQINMKLDRYGLGYRRHSDIKFETQNGPVAPKDKIILIIHASPNELETTIGKMHIYTKSDLHGIDYQRLVEHRAKLNICPICGGAFSLFRKCRSGMH